MIIIESDTLITIAVAVVAIGVSSVVTWYFSKRRYSSAHKPVSEGDVELEKAKNEFRSELLVFLFLVALILGGLGFILILALSSP